MYIAKLLFIRSEAEEDNSEKCVSKAPPQLTNKIALKSLEPSNFKILLADAQNTTLKSEMSSTACGDAAKNSMCFNINFVLNDETLKAIVNNGLTMTINLASN